MTASWNRDVREIGAPSEAIVTPVEIHSNPARTIPEQQVADVWRKRSSESGDGTASGRFAVSILDHQSLVDEIQRETCSTPSFAETAAILSFRIGLTIRLIGKAELSPAPAPSPLLYLGSKSFPQSTS
jgi:hypothetical protein